MKYSNPFQTAIQSEIVLKRDDRKYVVDTTRAPFRWICSLEVEFPEPVLYALGPLEQPGSNWNEMEPSIRGCGTGLLISKRKVLTAAHVITGLKQTGTDQHGKPVFKLIAAKKVTVIPGRNEDKPGNSSPFGNFWGKQIWVHPKYRMLFESSRGVGLITIKRALSKDIGLIKLAGGPGKHPGWWGRDNRYRITKVNDSFLRRLAKARIHLAGYPGDKGKISCGSLYYSTDRVVSTHYSLRGQRQNLLLYRADTFAGMSGSPVWVKGKDGVCWLVGVHSSFFMNGVRSCNVGVVI